MLLTPLAIATGLALGLIRGGSLAGLRSAGVRYWPLVGVGVVLQTAERWGAVPLRLTLLIVGLFLLVVSTMANVHLKGAAITGFGLSLNLAVVVVNGHVPLRAESLEAVGGIPADADPAGYALNGLWRFEDDGTALRSLGDIVPVTPFDDVISFGDLILLAGLVILFMNLLLRQPRHGLLVDDVLVDDVLAASQVVLASEVVTAPDALDLRERGQPPLGVEEVGALEDVGVSHHPSAGRRDQP